MLTADHVLDTETRNVSAVQQRTIIEEHSNQRILMVTKADAPLKRVVQLKEVDGIEIISLMDNSVDFLSTIEREEAQQVRKWVKESKGEDWMKKHFRLPMAEHGFSMLIRIFYNGASNSVLFDTGGSPEGVVTNAERMGLIFLKSNPLFSLMVIMTISADC